MNDPRMYPTGAAAKGSDWIKYMKVYTVSLDLASVAANTTAEQDLTVTGVEAGDLVLAFYPNAALSVALGVSHCRVKSANTITAGFTNATGGALDATAQSFTLIVMRKGTA